jgi:hypothetical protein
MRIIVDADACPVKEEIIRIAKNKAIEVHFFADVNHQIKTDYGVVTTVDQGADSVDIALVNKAMRGDVIVTQDYGVATLAIGKDCLVIHPSGKILDTNNIDQLMFERHISRKERSKGKRGPKFKKRTTNDNLYFEEQLRKLVEA